MPMKIGVAGRDEQAAARRRWARHDRTIRTRSRTRPRGATKSKAKARSAARRGWRPSPTACSRSPSRCRSSRSSCPRSSATARCSATNLSSSCPAYAGYVLASAVIGLYWVQHHFSGAIFRTTGHWFVIATTMFLTAIGFIAFPARVFAEHFADAAARPAAAQYWVVSLAVLSLAWLLKWTVGRRARAYRCAARARLCRSA